MMIELTREEHCSVMADSSAEIDVGRLVEEAMAEYDADDPLLVSYQTRG